MPPDDNGVYRLPIPIGLASLSENDLSTLSRAADILDRCPETIDIPGGDIGGHMTRTLRPDYLRHSLREIVRLRRGQA